MSATLTDVYNWVLEIGGYSSTEYTQTQSDKEANTIIPLITSVFSCASGWTSFTGNDALLFTKGVALLIVNNFQNRGSSAVYGDIIEMRNAGDLVKFGEISYEKITYIEEAWEYLSAVSCISVDVLASQVVSTFSATGKRRQKRSLLGYGSAGTNPLYALISNSSIQYDFEGTNHVIAE